MAPGDPADGGRFWFVFLQIVSLVRPGARMATDYMLPCEHYLADGVAASLIRGDDDLRRGHYGSRSGRGAPLPRSAGTAAFCGRGAGGLGSFQGQGSRPWACSLGLQTEKGFLYGWAELCNVYNVLCVSSY